MSNNTNFGNMPDSQIVWQLIKNYLDNFRESIALDQLTITRICQNKIRKNGRIKRALLQLANEEQILLVKYRASFLVVVHPRVFEDFSATSLPGINVCELQDKNCNSFKFH